MQAAGSVEAQLEQAMILYEDAQRPAKRLKAGRPRKGEEIAFNILTFLQTERKGMCKLLTREEALGHFWFLISDILYFFILRVFEAQLTLEKKIADAGNHWQP